MINIVHRVLRNSCEIVCYTYYLSEKVRPNWRGRRYSKNELCCVLKNSKQAFTALQNIYLFLRSAFLHRHYFLDIFLNRLVVLFLYCAAFILLNILV